MRSTLTWWFFICHVWKPPIPKIVLGLELSISSSQGFYKKITTLEIDLDDDLVK